MWEALEQSAWVKAMGETGWLYAGITVTHFLTMFWFIGSIAIVDLRVMGVAARKQNVGELAGTLFPWAWTGFGLAMVSGFFMFTTSAGDLAPDPVFQIKLALILVSAVFAVFVQRGVRKWALAAEIPTGAKILAVISLLLWIATILCSSEIPSREGLG
jgi:hypothetical protein